MKTQKSIHQYLKHLCITGTLAMLVACGGGGSSDSDDDDSSTSNASSGESVVSRGVITQLGSIWVNGCRYVKTANGKYKNDDDESASFDDYEVGMSVSIKGSKQDDSNCEADEVEYEAEIEGMADVNGDIYGVTIVRTPKTNAAGIPDPLDNGTRYEVSGVWIDDHTLEATYIKEDDDTDVIDEIKGYVKNDGPNSFDVYGITFGWTGTPNVADGDFVEVHFNACMGAAPNVTCTATKVELEDDYFDEAEGLEVEIEGAVALDTTGCPAEADFKVNGICIDSNSKPALWMDGLAGFADLVEGSRVEAEGHMVAGTPRDYLRADKVKGRGNRVRISSYATNPAGSATSGTFELVDGNIDVTVTSVTDYDDITFGNIDNLNHRIEVRGVRTGSNSMLALRVKLEDDDDDKMDEHELRAEVDLDGARAGAGSITVMQVTATGDGATELELDDDIAFVGTLSQFLRMIDDNDNAADGPRDVVEVEIDTSGPYYAEKIELEEQDD